MSETGFAAEEARCLVDQIAALADEDHEEFMASNSPTGRKVYGVRMPQLRRITRDWHRAHGELERSDLVNLVEALWGGESREEQTVSVLLLEQHKHWIPDLTQAHFDRWRRGLESWEATDGLGWVLALWLSGNPDTRLGYLSDLIGDVDVWSRRMALVATVRINRGQLGPTIPCLTLQLIDRAVSERHPMITKAVSWALRELIRHHRDQAAAYMESNQQALARHIVREVSNKLRTGLKSGKGTGATSAESQSL